MPLFDRLYSGILFFANFRLYEMYLCRILAFVVLAFLLYISRLISSFYVKVFAIVISLILYFFPELIQKFVM
jgi:hypothetical protein